MDNEAESNWYLVQCKPRQDARAQEHLERQGVCCYRPQHKRERLLKGPRQVVEESLFPGYLFIRMSSQDNWMPLRSTRGVARIVSFGGVPLPVADSLIRQLQARETSVSVASALSPGDAVRLEGGALDGLEAIFVCMDGVERVVLLLRLLQQERQVRAPLHMVRKS